MIDLGVDLTALLFTAWLPGENTHVTPPNSAVTAFRSEVMGEIFGYHACQYFRDGTRSYSFVGPSCSSCAPCSPLRTYNRNTSFQPAAQSCTVSMYLVFPARETCSASIDKEHHCFWSGLSPNYCLHQYSPDIVHEGLTKLSNGCNMRCDRSIGMLRFHRISRFHQEKQHEIFESWVTNSLYDLRALLRLRGTRRTLQSC